MSRATTSNRRRAPRRDTPAPSRAMAKGLATILVTGLVIAIGISAYNGVPTRDYQTLFVEVPNIGNLIKHDPVRVGGVRVGQVEGKDITPSGRARVKLQLEPDVELPADTTVAIRANGLLGARYVQLIPGNRPAGRLEQGTTLRARNDVLSFGVPETLDTLDEGSRGGLGKTVAALGEGLLGNGLQLNRGLDSAAATTSPFFTLADRLLAPETALGELVPSLDRAMAPLDRSRRNISAALPPLATALQPFIDERAAVRATLDKAPGTLAAADDGLRRGRRLLTSADALATAVHRTLPTVPVGLTQATALLREADTPLRRTDRLLREAGRTVPAVLALTRAASPVLKPLGAALDTLVPILDEVAPYKCDIVNVAIVFRSMTGFGIPGEGPGGPPMMFRAALVPSPEILSQLGGVKLNPDLPTRNAYPAPCTFKPTEYPVVSASPDR